MPDTPNSSILLPPQLGCALWLVDLDAPLAPGAASTLSDDERARAERFAFARDRTRFIAAHVALRQVLSRQLGRDAATLCFALGPEGKPRLVDVPLGRSPQFNLSHSGAHALIALDMAGDERAVGMGVGVDIEIVREVTDAQAIASAYFDPDECRALATLPAATQAHAFLRAWTRKEACLKALGTGFSGTRIPSTGIDAAPRQVHLGGANVLPAGYAQLCSFELRQAGAVASLAVLMNTSIPSTGPVLQHGIASLTETA